MKTPWPVLWVTWTDSVIIRGEIETERIGGPGVMDSVGWLVRRTAREIVLGQEWDAAGKNWRHVVVIPVCSVLRVRVISKPPREK